jgi:hypothetical protein
MIRRTAEETSSPFRHMHGTQRWFHFPVETPMGRITVATAPVMSVDEQQRLRLIRNEQRR